MRKLEKQNPLNELTAQLQKMEESSIVDLAVLKTLDELIDSCHSAESFWKDNKKVSIQDSFWIYHASRNVRIILEKMKKRFTEAEEKHENPAVVHESIAVIPPLSEICASIFFLTERAPTKELVNMLSEKVAYLRETAYINSLLPTPEEEMKELDKKRLQNRFDQFANTLQAMFT